MLCFTYSSTSLAVLQLGGMCPVPWAVLPGGFWCSAAVCSPGSCPFPSLLKVKSCTQCYCGASDIFQISSLQFSSPHKASFLPPPLKSRTKPERGRKSRSRTFVFLAFKSNAPKTGRGLSFITHEVQYLTKQFLVSHGGSVKELSTNRGACCLLSAGGRQGMAMQQSSLLGGCAGISIPFDVACVSGKEVLSQCGDHYCFLIK